MSQFQSRKWVKQALVAGSLCALVLVSACSSSSGGDKKDAGEVKATGTPVYVGFVNSDSGGFALPEITKATQATADYINGHGGMNGHPVKLDLCSTDGTPAASTKCANQFVTDKVLAVLNGYDLGMDAAQPVYKQAGLHIFGAISSTAIAMDPDNTIMVAPFVNFYAANGALLKTLGATSTVFVLPNIGPEIKQLYGLIAAAANKAGVKTSLTLVAPANPDVTAAVTAAKAQHADMLDLNFQENDCTNAIRTAKSLGWTGKIYAGSCSQFIDTLGAQAAGTYAGQYLFPPAAKAAAAAYDPQLKDEFDTYETAMKAGGQEAYIKSAFAAYGFSTLMTFANIVKGIPGEPTQAAINAAMASFKGHQVLGLQQDCTAKIAPGGACGRYFLPLQVQADGTMTLVGGKPLDVSAAQ